MKRSLIPTLRISILVAIVSPFVLGVKDPTLIAICFSSVWFIYVVLIFNTTFTVKPGLRIKLSHDKGVRVVKYELKRRDFG